MQTESQKYSHQLLSTERKSVQGTEKCFLKGYSLPMHLEDHYLLWNVEFDLGYEDISPECLRVEIGYFNRKPYNDGKFITPPQELYEEIQKINNLMNKRYLNFKKGSTN
ncbi:hypothetical protein [Bacillus sp. ISL-46]|uniref:hypothetical protein n=1 Tax=Bacillus sp. ISL-46 TaxID=2819129 RepID=UPI001BE8F02A|nr:hypothetical protein [Bacillus sp. ISL-46]MBT2721436.1 hypothetical protein [Bacillus sp. ISL-46]